MYSSRAWLASLCFALVVAKPTHKPDPKPAVTFKWDNIKYVYAFGDSYTFVEGAQGVVNFSFIGSELDYSFTPEELLTNTINTNRTSSEGANWIEFTTGCFGGSPFDCERQLWDFAFAGSDVSGDILPLHHNYTTSLVRQVEQWRTYAADVIPRPANETLTFWWIGINDTGDTINNATITDWDAFWDYEVSTYFNAVQSTYDLGMKQHLFVNVPPEERAPGANTNATKVERTKATVDGFNAAVVKHTELFAQKNPDATVLSFDAHAAFTQILDNPTEYGFTDVIGYCTCADPTGYFWYNTGHPTQRVHELVSEALVKQLKAC